MKRIIYKSVNISEYFEGFDRQNHYNIFVMNICVVHGCITPFLGCF